MKVRLRPIPVILAFSREIMQMFANFFLKIMKKGKILIHRYANGEIKNHIHARLT